MVAKNEEYTCEHCAGVFTKVSTDEEMKDEFKGLFPGHSLKDDDLVIICDSCFNDLMGVQRAS